MHDKTNMVYESLHICMQVYPVCMLLKGVKPMYLHIKCFSKMLNILLKNIMMI